MNYFLFFKKVQYKPFIDDLMLYTVFGGCINVPAKKEKLFFINTKGE
mgnify:CR=1 FL=1